MQTRYQIPFSQFIRILICRVCRINGVQSNITFELIIWRTVFQEHFFKCRNHTVTAICSTQYVQISNYFTNIVIRRRNRTSHWVERVYRFVQIILILPSNGRQIIFIASESNLCCINCLIVVCRTSHNKLTIAVIIADIKSVERNFRGCTTIIWRCIHFRSPNDITV